MVCIYCFGPTQVTNSRSQKRTNTVWRRRQCRRCRAIFSSIESGSYATTLVVQKDTSHIVPFSRDELFLSIYEACRHRPTATTDASALTDTAISKLVPRNKAGAIERKAIVETVGDILRHFDHAAHVQYTAYHPAD